jgi:RND family efflux transporter MFP subunit
MKTFITILSAVSFLMITEACTESKGNHPAVPRTSEAIPVRIMPLQKSVHPNTIRTSGNITTDSETLLSFKVGGVVKRVFAEDGQRITKNQTLAVLDLTEVNGFVKQAEAAYEKAARDLARAQNLYSDSVATLEQLQNAQTAHEVALAQLNTAKFNQGFSEIKAPADGYVLKKFINAGQLVNPGDPVFKTNGAGNGRWILKVGVSDKQWAAIRINDKVAVTLDAFPGDTLAGNVLRKAGTSDPSTGAFTIEIEVVPHGKQLASGMFASAVISTSSASELWDVPYEAVLDASGNEGFVFVADDNNMAIRRPVVISSFNGTTIQVASGLEDASNVIIAGSAYLTDNSPVIIVE